jgi:hypothetical protein
MTSKISYYFTLFKKFQVINHVPTQTVHGNAGAPAGGFNLNDPNAPFSPTNSGTPLTAGDFSPANNPLWAILNSRASGTPGFTLVPIGGGAQAGSQWPTMPTLLLPEWTAFQVTPSAGSKLLDAFAHWISVDQQTKDIPNAVIATKPATFAGPDAGVVPFVCSKPGDQGARPTSLPSFWATSLIFLVDPNTGATVTPGSLAAGAEYYLAAVVGNRGNTNGGHSLNQPQALQFAASVMVWNTFLSPGVELPSLTNLDLNDTNGIYEQYFLRSGQYDVIGFRLNVQIVFNGIIAAINNAVANGLDLGGMTPEQWVHSQPAHLCSKVVARLQGTSFPNVETSPEQDARIAQKNLAPFDITLVSTDPNPNIIWKNFLVGQPVFLLIKGAGKNKLVLRTDLPQSAVRLYLAMPARTFEQFVRGTRGELVGLKQVDAKKFAASHKKNALPFPSEAVILQVTGEEPSLEFGPMHEGQIGAMAIGIEYIPAKLKHGTTGDIAIAQESMVPRLERGSGCYKVERAVIGGFTLQLRANDPNIDRKGERIAI